MERIRKYEPIFGSWHAKRVIGHGSFGTVYEIYRDDFGIKDESALKVISIPQDDEEIRKMKYEGSTIESIQYYYDNVVREIVSEIVILKSLQGNKNIVGYEDHTVAKHEDGIGYDILIRMELLTPLVQYRSEHSFGEKDVARLGIDICRALQLCQEEKIIHRDIKPDNIFVTEQGDYKLGDFGIARTIEKTSSDLSRKGTYTYMAPEVYRGMQYGKTVDIYSLGILMYSMLNGNRPPFLPPQPAEITHNEKEKALYRRMQGEEIPALYGVSADLMVIILKACAYHSSDRYQSAEEMRSALEQYVNNDGHSAVISNPDNASEDKTEVLTCSEALNGGGDRKSIDNADYAKTEVLDPASSQAEQIYGGHERVAAETKQQKNKRKNHFKIIVAIACLAVVLLAVLGIITVGNSHKSDNQETMNTSADSASTEGEYASADNVLIEDRFLDYSNYEVGSYEGSDVEQYMIYYTITVNNKSNESISQIDFTAKKTDSDFVMDGYLEDNDEWSWGKTLNACGYIAPGKTGQMFGSITTNESELNELKAMGQLPVDKAEVEDVYPSGEGHSYIQPYGSLLSYNEDEDECQVKIHNDNNYSITLNPDYANIYLIGFNDSGEAAEVHNASLDDSDNSSFEINKKDSTDYTLFIFDDAGLKCPIENYKVYVVDWDD